MIIGILAFKRSLSNISLSIATVIWSGTSLILTIAFDAYLYNTKLGYRTIFFICLCLISIVGLNADSKN
jgi:multidrug transporter EmrE-like cation transporter